MSGVEEEGVTKQMGVGHGVRGRKRERGGEWGERGGVLKESTLEGKGRGVNDREVEEAQREGERGRQC